MSGINKVILIGHLGKDPEVRTFENGTKKANFSLATTEYYKDKDGKTIYTTDVIVEEHEFAQNKDSGAGADSSETPKTDKDGFMEAKDGEIPFD